MRFRHGLLDSLTRLFLSTLVYAQLFSPTLSRSTGITLLTKISCFTFLLTLIICAAKQPPFLEKIFSAFFAIPLPTLVLYKFPKGSSLLDMTC